MLGTSVTNDSVQTKSWVWVFDKIFCNRIFIKDRRLALDNFASCGLGTPVTSILASQVDTLFLYIDFKVSLLSCKMMGWIFQIFKPPLTVGLRQHHFDIQGTKWLLGSKKYCPHHHQDRLHHHQQQSYCNGMK